MKTAKTKTYRQNVIKELIDSAEIKNHFELVDALLKKGIAVAQATLSRDLVEMGVVKKGGAYKLSEFGDESSGLWKSILRSRGKYVKKAGNHLLVVKVDPGAAQLVASEIEKQEWTEVVGIVAGDDTLFIAIDQPSSLKKIFAKLNACFPPS